MKKRYIFLFLLIVSLFGYLLVSIPKWQLYGINVVDPKERVTLENDLRGNLAHIFGWALVLVGFYYFTRRITVAEKTAEASKRGEITERFTRSINQLGAVRENGEKRLETRIGGIYALEGIARESEEYYSPAIEILSAYVRENAPWQEKEGEAQKRLKVVEEHTKTDYSSFPKVPADIQAALTVLGRRSRSYRKGESDRLNLSQTNLQESMLANANLEGVFLFNVNLKDAVLTKSRLENAFLDESYLQEANLNYANLERASLKRTVLRGASMMGARLQNSKLSGAALQEADLRGVDLRGADLNDANLEGANLQKAKLKGATLRGANLSGANLEGTDFEEADLQVADLREAKFHKANLSGALLQGCNLNGAIFEGANLRGADLTSANLQGAFLYESNLEGANLDRTSLQKAHLEKTNLMKAKSITVNELSKAETLYAVKLETKLRKKMKNEFRHLLEKP